MLCWTSHLGLQVDRNSFRVQALGFGLGDGSILPVAPWVFIGASGQVGREKKNHVGGPLKYMCSRNMSRSLLTTYLGSGNILRSLPTTYLGSGNNERSLPTTCLPGYCFAVVHPGTLREGIRKDTGVI